MVYCNELAVYALPSQALLTGLLHPLPFDAGTYLSFFTCQAAPQSILRIVNVAYGTVRDDLCAHSKEKLRLHEVDRVRFVSGAECMGRGWYATFESRTFCEVLIESAPSSDGLIQV